MAPTQLVTQTILTPSCCESCCADGSDYLELPLFPRAFFHMSAECEFFSIDDEEDDGCKFFFLDDAEEAVADAEDVRFCFHPLVALSRLRSRASTSMRSPHEFGDFPT